MTRNEPLKKPEVFVETRKGVTFTNSLDVAEKFGKRHDHVMASIRKIVRDFPDNSLPNFRECSYSSDNGQRYPMFEMTRSGFAVLAMGFTGKEAIEWKFKYERAFSAMETALLNQQNLSWQNQRAQGKLGRRTETDTIKDFVAYAKDQGSSRAEFYYSNLTKATYKALFLIKDRFPGPFRDMLDTMQLSYLAAAEYVAANALRDGMAEGIHYKDIYKLAKGKLENYAIAVGVTPVIAHTANQQISA